MGIEHEFRVELAGRPVDFRRILHDLGIAGARIDPGDRNAYRLPSGAAITADGREAEIAIAPVGLGPGFGTIVAARVRAARAELAAALGPDATLRGYSTHISISVPDCRVQQLARSYAERFAPALTMLVDGPTSPGLLVRPRPGRLELGGEFVDGNRLQAAATFALGSVLALLDAEGRPFGRRRLPPRLDLAIEPARERFGWFVGRRAGQPDVHQMGRSTELTTRSGQRTTGQLHLDATWEISRATLVGRISNEDLARVDAIVAGEARLGVELTPAASITIIDGPSTPVEPDDPSPFGAIFRPRARPGMTIRPEILSWDFVVLRVTESLAGRPGRSAIACLPRRLLGSVIDALDRGDLDSILAAYLALNADVRLLASNGQTEVPGLYRGVVAGARLLRSEHGPLGNAGDRPGKRQEYRASDQASARLRPDLTKPAVAAASAGLAIFGIPATVAAAAAGVVAIAVVGGAVLFARPESPPAVGSFGPPAVASPAAIVSLDSPSAQIVAPLAGLSVGSATVVLGGNGQGHITVPFSGAAPVTAKNGNGTLLIWGIAGATGGLNIVLPAANATGALSTATNQAGIWMDVPDALDTSDPGNVAGEFAAGAGLGFDERTDIGNCTIVTVPTPTGGLSGTFNCPVASQTSGISATGSFAAEPAPAGAGSAVPSSAAGAVILRTGSATVEIRADGRDTTNQVSLSEGTIGGDGLVVAAWDDRTPDANGGYQITRWLDLSLTPDPGGTTTTSSAGEVEMGVSSIDATTGVLETTDQVTTFKVLACTVLSARTLTGGVAGTVHCVGRYDQPDVPFDATATFAAEP